MRDDHGVRLVGTALTAAGIVLVAIGAGYVVALILTISVNAILPLRPEDAGTLRVWIPSLIAYIAWAATGLFVFRGLWRWLRTP